MDISGEFKIPASRPSVWEALNDPDRLARSIPGCESIERESSDRFTAVVEAKIGPVRSKFSCELDLSDLDPPSKYTISGRGKGGPAGFGKGQAVVRLEEDGEGTLLKYSAELQVGGKLAQIGSRLVAGAARKIADDFFSRFAALFEEDESPGQG
ncbi:CoxG family protein [Thioalkalivibrio sp. HK1]|uniref:CoxG family protein n=1 Tax=Thioalkalivibrio sp. HK1 TaxID=1469245 RepID=UPI00046FCB65|nr:carbon monoxide dehydrogenase subunit G [Thioalkalivibrio sp. HK1]